MYCLYAPFMYCAQTDRRSPHDPPSNIYVPHHHGAAPGKKHIPLPRAPKMKLPCSDADTLSAYTARADEVEEIQFVMDGCFYNIGKNISKFPTCGPHMSLLYVDSLFQLVLQRSVGLHQHTTYIKIK